MESVLKNKYFNPNHPGSYSNTENLYKHASRVDSTITRKQVKNFLIGEDSYILYRQRRLRFPTAKTHAPTLDFSWQTDLCDVSNLANSNDSVRFILFCIDVFSRHLWRIPLKNKKKYHSY